MYIWKMEMIQSRRGRIRGVLLLVVLTLFLFLHNWTREAIPLAHIKPKVEQTDISPLLEQPEQTEADLQILSAQTGLHPQSIQNLLDQGRGQELLVIQQQYFAPVHIESLRTTLLTVSEVLVDKEGCRIAGMPLVDVQDGDILITKNSRFLGWRNGHAALVVDAEEGLLLEAIMPGTNSKISPISKWSTYPSFQVLRLKDEHRKETENGGADLRKQIADYASKELTDVPYLLVAGILERSFLKKMDTVEAAGPTGLSDTALKGTQCAHLVWYAYKQFGIDLDSDGGIIVTPYDIQNSEYLEKIQTYGY